MENKLQDQLDSMDKKYNSLKDQLAKLTKDYEEEKNNKNEPRQKHSEEFKIFENKIKNLFMEERQHMQNYSEDLFKGIENRIRKVDKENKQEGEIIKGSIIHLKNVLEVKKLILLI
jgi:hypothetical protein